MDQPSSARRRRILAQQALTLELGPERRRDVDLEDRAVLGDLVRRAGAGNQRGDVRVAERELQRGAGET